MAAFPILRLRRSSASPSRRKPRVLQFASPSFDAAMSEICDSFAVGRRRWCCRQDERSGEALADARSSTQKRHSCDLAAGACWPSLPEDLPLQTLIVAGEACSPDEVGALVEGPAHDQCYGPTETTVCATMSEPLSGAESCACRLVVRSGTRGFMFWTVVLSLFRRVLRGSFTLRVWVLRGAIWGVLG